MNRWAVPLLYCVFIIIMIVLADIGALQPQLTWLHSIPMGDKIGHFFLYGTMSALFITAFRFRTVPVGKRHVYLGALLIACIAVLEECSQLFFEHRKFEGLDMLANIIGVSLAAFVMYRVNKHHTPTAAD